MFSIGYSNLQVGSALVDLAPQGFDSLAPPDSREFIRQRRTAIEVKSCSYQPLISVLIPVYNTPVQYLRLAIESVISYYPKTGMGGLSCSTAIVIQHATEAALALDRSIAKG
jgi:hypothetical protein